MNMIQESSEKDPESALEIFLKRYYRQEDVEMRDLQATSELIEDSIVDTEADVVTKSQKILKSQVSERKQ